MWQYAFGHDFGHMDQGFKYLNDNLIMFNRMRMMVIVPDYLTQLSVNIMRKLNRVINNQLWS